MPISLPRCGHKQCIAVKRMLGWIRLLLFQLLEWRFRIIGVKVAMIMQQNFKLFFYTLLVLYYSAYIALNYLTKPSHFLVKGVFEGNKLSL